MKKLLVLGLLCFGIANVFAFTHANNTPEKLAQLKAKTDNWSKVCVIMCQMPDGLSVNEMTTQIVAKATQQKIDEQFTLSCLATHYLWWTGMTTKDNANDVVELCKKVNNKFYLAKFYEIYNNKYITVDQKTLEQVEFQYLKQGTGDKKHVTTVFNYWYKRLPDIEEATAKAHLKTLNRIYSAKLLDDKTAWEPIVAKIRTCLETY